MLSYRSFFNTEETADFDRIVASQIHGWLRDKGLRDDNLSPGRNAVAAGTFVDIIDDAAPDDSRRFRFRLTEPTGWVTEVTTEHAPGQSGWVWLEIRSPDDAPWTGTPKVLRRLVASCEARDGIAVLRDEPMVVRLDDIDDLVDVVCDPDRRGPIFVAGSSDDLPWDPWKKTVGGLLAETVGLAGSYILDPQLTAEFNQRFDTHEVPVGAIRTFLPAVDPVDEFDARRHRILGAWRIAHDETRHLRRTLGRFARRHLIDQPLPTRLSRVDRVLQRAESDLLVAHLTPSPDATAAADEKAAPVSNTTIVESTADVELGVAVGAEDYLLIRDLVREVSGMLAIEPASIAEVVRLARHGLAQLANQEDVRARLHELQSRTEALENERDQLFTDLEEAQLSHAEDVETLTGVRDKLRYLQRQLEQLGQGEVAWTGVPASEQTKQPSSFADLLERAGELRHVVIGDDRGPAYELDEHDLLGTIARKAWLVLLALNDYAEARSQGVFTHGVHTYLKQTPSGCFGYPATSHAASESESVDNNPKFHDARVFPVPTSVDPAGELYMAAHFKLGAKRMISPRVHYFDASGVDGKIYVGYIGKHLPNNQSR